MVILPPVLHLNYCCFIVYLGCTIFPSSSNEGGLYFFTYVTTTLHCKHLLLFFNSSCVFKGISFMNSSSISIRTSIHCLSSFAISHGSSQFNTIIPTVLTTYSALYNLFKCSLLFTFQLLIDWTVQYPSMKCCYVVLCFYVCCVSYRKISIIDYGVV